MPDKVENIREILNQIREKNHPIVKEVVLVSEDGLSIHSTFEYERTESLVSILSQLTFELAKRFMRDAKHEEISQLLISSNRSKIFLKPITPKIVLTIIIETEAKVYKIKYINSAIASIKKIYKKYSEVKIG
ncbi:MAG: roadblock/LC7 domain-containing protein [Candidatus Brocadiae bacterium]|nr:roadblock/LC7 domain-containing protein [Candidatus Brocadiia bacterium]